MKIGVIGSGNVGSTLGRRWAQAGHEVLFGSRDPRSEALRTLVASAGVSARAGSNQEAAAFGEVLLVAVPHDALTQTLTGLKGVAGKVVIDAVNLVSATPGPHSVASHIAELWPEARVVKSFNTMGANIMADPKFGGEAASDFICGDDADAKGTVAELARVLGFEVVDCGPLSNAILLEGLARLWIDLAYRQGMGRDIAFRLMKR